MTTIFNHIFGTGEARHFKFGVQIDIEELYRMHYILPTPRSRKRMRSGSRELPDLEKAENGAR